MDLLRLIAIASLAACGQAGAQAEPPPPATSGLRAPAEWSALPELATAVATASASDDVAVLGAEAWGEPARGCYATWISLRAARTTTAQVLAGLATHGLTTTDVVAAATDDGELTASFTRPPFQGRLRARVAAGTIVVLACFANDREPASCHAACTTLLEGLK